MWGLSCDSCLTVSQSYNLSLRLNVIQEPSHNAFGVVIIHHPFETRASELTKWADGAFEIDIV